MTYMYMYMYSTCSSMLFQNHVSMCPCYRAERLSLLTLSVEVMLNMYICEVDLKEADAFTHSAVLLSKLLITGTLLIHVCIHVHVHTTTTAARGTTLHVCLSSHFLVIAFALLSLQVTLIRDLVCK